MLEEKYDKITYKLLSDLPRYCDCKSTYENHICPYELMVNNNLNKCNCCPVCISRCTIDLLQYRKDGIL